MPDEELPLFPTAPVDPAPVPEDPRGPVISGGVRFMEELKASWDTGVVVQKQARELGGVLRSGDLEAAENLAREHQASQQRLHELAGNDEAWYDPRYWAKGAVEMVPYMAENVGGGLAGQAVVVGSGAAIGALAGAGGGVPGALSGAGAGALAGWKWRKIGSYAGSFTSSMDVMTAGAFQEYINDGMDRKAAFYGATVAGGVGALLESLQLDILGGVFEKATVQTVKNVMRAKAGRAAVFRLSKALLKHAGVVVSESTVEATQKTIQDLVSNVAAEKSKTGVKYSMGELFTRAGSTFLESLGPMAVFAGGTRVAADVTGRVAGAVADKAGFGISETGEKQFRGQTFTLGRRKPEAQVQLVEDENGGLYLGMDEAVAEEFEPPSDLTAPGEKETLAQIEDFVEALEKEQALDEELEVPPPEAQQPEAQQPEAQQPPPELDTLFGEDSAVKKAITQEKVLPLPKLGDITEPIKSLGEREARIKFLNTGIKKLEKAAKELTGSELNEEQTAQLNRIQESLIASTVERDALLEDSSKPVEGEMEYTVAAVNRLIAKTASEVHKVNKERASRREAVWKSRLAEAQKSRSDFTELKKIHRMFVVQEAKDAGVSSDLRGRVAAEVMAAEGESALYKAVAKGRNDIAAAAEFDLERKGAWQAVQSCRNFAPGSVIGAYLNKIDNAATVEALDKALWGKHVVTVAADGKVTDSESKGFVVAVAEYQAKLRLNKAMRRLRRMMKQMQLVKGGTRATGKFTADTQARMNRFLALMKDAWARQETIAAYEAAQEDPEGYRERYEASNGKLRSPEQLEWDSEVSQLAERLQTLYEARKGVPKNRRALAGQLVEQLIQYAEQLITTGKTARQELMEARAAQRESRQTLALNAINASPKKGREAKSSLGRVWDMWFGPESKRRKRKNVAASSAFRTVLRVMAANAPIETQDAFVEMLDPAKAYAKRERALSQDEAFLETLIRKIIGKRYVEFSIDQGAADKVDIRYRASDGWAQHRTGIALGSTTYNQLQDVSFTRPELMDLYAHFYAARNVTSTAQALLNAGYSTELEQGEDSLEHAVKLHLTAEEKQIVEAVVEYMTDQYPRMNAVFRQQRHVDLPFVPTYWPMIKGDIQDVTRLFGEDQDVRKTVAPSSTKSRLDTKKPVRLANFWQKVRNYQVELAHYEGFHEWAQAVDDILANPEFRVGVDARNHEQLWRIFKTETERLKSGNKYTYDRSDPLVGVIEYLSGALSSSTFGLRALNAIGNLTSGLTISYDVGAAGLLKGQAFVLKNWKESWAAIYGNPLLRARWDQGISPEMALAKTRGIGQLFPKTAPIANAIQSAQWAAFLWMDQLTAALNLSVYGYYRSQGMSVEEAADTFATRIEQTQQSSSLVEISSYEANNILFRLFGQFGKQVSQMQQLMVNENIKLERKWADLAGAANYDEMSAAQKTAALLPLAFSLEGKRFASAYIATLASGAGFSTLMSAALFAGGPPGDDDEWWDELGQYAVLVGTLGANTAGVYSTTLGAAPLLAAVAALGAAEFSAGRDPDKVKEDLEQALLEGTLLRTILTAGNTVLAQYTGNLGLLGQVYAQTVTQIYQENEAGLRVPVASVIDAVTETAVNLNDLTAVYAAASRDVLSGADLEWALQNPTQYVEDMNSFVGGEIDLASTSEKILRSSIRAGSMITGTAGGNIVNALEGLALAYANKDWVGAAFALMGTSRSVQNQRRELRKDKVTDVLKAAEMIKEEAEDIPLRGAKSDNLDVGGTQP